MSSSINVDFYVNKLKKIASKSYNKGNVEKSLAAISSCANILYHYNQYYVDDFLEDILLKISHRFSKDEELKKVQNKITDKNSNNVVLFYDGFGLDNRGIASNITWAIAKNNYKLVYVTKKNRRDKQPLLKNLLKDFEVEYCYIDNQCGYIECARQLYNTIINHNPKFSFFYTFPSDVSGVVAFNSVKDFTIRFQVDLTDHAFWLGINAFDYISSGREYSVSIQKYYRHIETSKMIWFDIAGYPMVPETKFEGLPFVQNTKFIFSGGALYKTLGDKNNTFYRIINHILAKHHDIVFYYLGEGDTTELEKLTRVYPSRVFYGKERKDFYEVLKRCLFCLNTYPMFGGMMMRYTALAGKLPLTLIHNSEAANILYKQGSREIEYDNLDVMLCDIDRIILDDNYRKDREKKLKGAVYDEIQYVNNIKSIIETNKSLLEYDFSEIEKVDTNKFRCEYKNRFKYKMIVNSLFQRKNFVLFPYFPFAFFIGFILMIYKKIFRR